MIATGQGTIEMQEFAFRIRNNAEPREMKGLGWTKEVGNRIS